MSAPASVSRKAPVEFDPELEEESKEAEKKLEREKMKDAVNRAVPHVQEASRASADACVFAGGIAAKAATLVYASAAAPFVEACVEEVSKEKETLYRATDASVQKTADLANRSIDSCC